MCNNNPYDNWTDAVQRKGLRKEDIFGTDNF
jgi:hypothetical protein